MSLLDALKGMAGQSANPNAKVAGGLVQALDEHPGGLAGLVQHMQNNGMGQQAQQWSQGQQATPEQIQQGVGGTGIIDKVAQRVGISPEAAKIGLAVVLPIVMSHLTRGGQQAPPQQGGIGSMASEIMGKFL